MKKYLIPFVAIFLVAGFQASQADNSAPASTPAVTTVSTPGAASASSKKKKKKATAMATAQSTPSATSVPTTQATVVPTKGKASATSTANPAPASVSPTLFSQNQQLYDEVGASGDLRKALAVAAKTLASSSKHDQSLFLWLGKVASGNDQERENAYLRLSIDGIAYGGPRKPWIVLTGAVYDQSGSGLKAGDAVEVAVDFRDIKVDYEGTKLGEVNKGNDIADQVYDILSTHSPYQWVLLAQNRKEQSAVPAFVVKAKEGYAFLQGPLHSTSR